MTDDQKFIHNRIKARLQEKDSGNICNCRFIDMKKLIQDAKTVNGSKIF